MTQNEDPSFPPLVIHPHDLSSTHHLLRVLLDEEPTSLHEALRRIHKRYPTYTALGTPEHPTNSTYAAWARLTERGWARYVERGAQRGLVITGVGECHWATLFENEVRSKYLRHIQQAYGEAAFRAAQARYPLEAR